jgi:hypothetical protein
VKASEAKKHEPPLDLVPAIERLGAEHPENASQVAAAVPAANEQMTAQKSAKQ